MSENHTTNDAAPVAAQDENKLIAERREKLKALREQSKAQGGVPFPNDFKPANRAAALIDAHVGLAVDVEDGDSPTLRFLLPGGDELPISIEVSRLLYQLDRDAYVEALNAARGAPAPAVEPVEEQGEST